MLLNLLFSLCLFGVTVAITPGPNNFMLASSGAQFGIRRSLAHTFGIRVGIAIMILLCCSGVGVLIQSSPELYAMLKYVGIGYMSWLALGLMFTYKPMSLNTASKPLTWYQATLFQLVNVKVWAAGISVSASYTLPTDYWMSVVWILLMMTLTGFASNISWVWFGKRVSRYLDTSTKVRLFNRSLGGLTLLSLLPLIHSVQ